MKNKTFLQKYERLFEISTWIIIILVIFFVKFLPKKVIDDGTSYILIGLIAGLALIYYLVIYRFFSKNKRLYLKDIADIVLIGILIHLLKDYGTYFYALYFIPIAAAALTLEFINALLIATIAAVFVIFEIFLGSQELLPQQVNVNQGVWQIGFILLITIFCRYLAVQIREERRQKEELAAHQKMLEEEAVRQRDFMNLTAHQLYTPLSISRGFTSMLNDANFGQLNPKQKEAVNEIYDSTTRMVSLVNELLSISRLETESFQLKKTINEPDQLLKNIVNELEQTKTNENVHILLELPAKVRPFMFDQEKIRQVVYNLISNAIKYTQKGNITVKYEVTHNRALFSVKDEGIGIDENDLGNLFQPFFRGKNILELDNKGTGLGLYIAKIIVSKHGGRIWADSVRGEGSTFYFELPLLIPEHSANK